MQKSLKDELHDIISGKSQVRFGTIIQTVSNYLKEGFETGPIVKDKKQVRKQEEKKLETYISDNGLWIQNIDFTQYVSEGAEQKVYLNDSEHVLKLNVGIYYESWTDYFHNLLLHNFFFSDTAYELIGFTRDNEIIYAVVKQNFVTITQSTNLEKVKEFLDANGFSNTRNNDYSNKELGVILEDLHDENVLTRNDVLFFIDTVFYLTEKFWGNKNR